MKEIYVIQTTLDVGSATDNIKSLLRELNASLSMCGISERITLRMCYSMRLECSRRLSQKEIAGVKRIIQQAANESAPHLRLKVQSMRRKSRKASEKSL